jgi:acetylornithine deacetylase
MRLSPCLRHLRDFVAIPSVNPMGRTDLDASIAGERRYAEHARSLCARMGLDAALVGEPERPSLVAEARAANAGSTVVIASHLDTVPVDGMEIDPFEPRIEAERLYGRGACDTKGGMAAALEALERVLGGGRLRRNVIVVGEADEEYGGRGALDVLAHLGARARAGRTWAIATEPTSLRLVTRHKGIAHADLVARGVSCHASDPGRGRSAISAIARAVLAIERLAARLDRRPDPALGPPTLSIGLVAGGSAANVVADRASLVLDRRLLPGEDAAGVRAEIEAALAEDGLDDVRVERCETVKAALGLGDDEPAVRACQRALVGAGLVAAPTVAAFGTDAGTFAAHGLPAVVLGPGSIEQAHTSREWVDVRQVQAMADWLVRLFESAD